MLGASEKQYKTPPIHHRTAAHWQWKRIKSDTTKRVTSGEAHDEVFIKYGFYDTGDLKRYSVFVMFYKNKVFIHTHKVLNSGKQNLALWNVYLSSRNLTHACIMDCS